MIIVINGHSSAGKSTILNHLKNSLSQLITQQIICLSIDKFFLFPHNSGNFITSDQNGLIVEKCFSNYTFNVNNPNWKVEELKEIDYGLSNFEILSNKLKNIRSDIVYGENGFRTLEKMPYLAKAYYYDGMCVLIDDVIYYNRLYEAYNHFLKNTTTFLVHLFCSEEEALRREMLRNSIVGENNRPVGLALRQREIIVNNPKIHHDLHFDTSNPNLEAITKDIFDHIRYSKPNAIHLNKNLGPDLWQTARPYENLKK